MLQWGHADDGVEASSFWPAPSPPALQWGHADDGVEDVEKFTDLRETIRGFNGATPMMAWKTSRALPTESQATLASMGPRR